MILKLILLIPGISFHIISSCIHDIFREKKL